MNSFFAMLKDSFREAVDGWIFPVMAGLIGLLVLIVLSFSVTPLTPEQAVGKVLRGQEMSVVHSDRGTNSRTGIFSYSAKVSDVKVLSEGAHPWEAKTRFTLEYVGRGFGPTGVEVDDAKSPTDVKQMEGGLFGDAFKEAVRYWASDSTAKEKPKFTNELAKEFVTKQVADVARLTVDSVELVDPKKPNQFVVTSSGGTRLGWAHTPSLFFGLWKISFLEAPLGSLVYLLENTLTNGLGAWVLLLAGVIVTAGFVPNMLRKGAIDLMLTKPVSRPLILIYKYFGGLTFVFLLMLLAALGVWGAVGVKTGVWAPGLLYCTAGVTFYFAILYACSTFVGVMSRNAIVSIVITIGFWFVVWLIGTTHSIVKTLDRLDVQQNRPGARQKATAKEGDKADAKAKDDKADKADDEATEDPDGPPKPPKGLVTFVDVLQRLTPRTKDLDAISTYFVARDLASPAQLKNAQAETGKINWVEVFGVAGGWIVLFLGLATLRFVTRSY